MSQTPWYSPYGVPVPAVQKVTTSRKELLDILVAFTVLTFALVVLFTRSSVLFGSTGVGLLSPSVLPVAGLAAAAALTGFVAHELAHKVVAERRGFWAEFRMSPMGLVFLLFTAFVGFLFAAPGATMVGGISELDRRSWGWTSLAGPMTNLSFAGAFYAASFGAYGFAPGLVEGLLFLAYINAWFGTFNLLPFGPLDGRKVLRWSGGIWGAAIAISGAVAVVCGLAAIVYGTPYLHL
jgi:Zn-dependent protease